MRVACLAHAPASVTASGGGPPLHEVVVSLVGRSYIVGPPLAGGLPCGWPVCVRLACMRATGLRACGWPALRVACMRATGLRTVALLRVACLAHAPASVTASGGGPTLHEAVVPLVERSYIVGPPLACGLRACVWPALRVACLACGLRACGWPACVRVACGSVG